MSKNTTKIQKFTVNKDKLIKLEYLRNKYGYSQPEMSELLGINLATYSRKVNRKLKFDLDEMLIIMMALNMRANKAGDQLLKLDDIFLN